MAHSSPHLRAGGAARGRARSRRRGAALVEFAICLPVLMLVVLGSIEAASAVFVRQGLAVAAYEGVRQVIRRDGDLTEAKARAQAVLDQRNIKNATITFEPANAASLPRGEVVTVRIQASMGANSSFFGIVMKNRNTVVTTSMVRE